MSITDRMENGGMTFRDAAMKESLNAGTDPRHARITELEGHLLEIRRIVRKQGDKAVRHLVECVCEQARLHD